MTSRTSMAFSFAGIFAPFTQAEVILCSPKGWQNYRNDWNTNRKTKEVVQICLGRGRPRVVSTEFTAHLSSLYSFPPLHHPQEKRGRNPDSHHFPEILKARALSWTMISSECTGSPRKRQGDQPVGSGSGEWMGFFRSWERRVMRYSSSESWQLPTDKQEGLQKCHFYIGI